MERTERPKANGASAPAQAVGAVEAVPRSQAIINQGLRTDKECAEYLTALMADMQNATVPVRVGNACLNGVGKLLKLVDMRQRYGDPEKSRTLQLVPESPEEVIDHRRQELMRQLAELDAASGKALANSQ